MRVLKKDMKLCLICMEEHEVQTVLIKDTEERKGEEVCFDATYEYCAHAEEYLETEEMIRESSLSMKDAYRAKAGLLTSKDIIAISEKYELSQKDFSEILDWGKATITRYENHQIQDRAHDDVLRKMVSDQKWFPQMLARAKGRLSHKAFEKYHKAASKEFKNKHNQYLKDSLEAIYAGFTDEIISGGVELNLNKVVETINYYASKVKSLHKVKLMKMLWYGDSISFKRRKKSITGLVYKALPMGAVPEGYELILELDGVEFETVVYDCDRFSFKFHPAEGFEIKELTLKDLEILDTFIAEVGHLNSQEIIDKMHDEEAYTRTERNSIISFSYAEN